MLSNVPYEPLKITKTQVFQQPTLSLREIICFATRKDYISRAYHCEEQGTVWEQLGTYIILPDPWPTHYPALEDRHFTLFPETGFWIV